MARTTTKTTTGSRARLGTVGVALAALTACGPSERPGPTPGIPTTEADAAAADGAETLPSSPEPADPAPPGPDAVPEDLPPPDGAAAGVAERVAYDLVRGLDGAEVTAGGLRIDFGTPGTVGYTLGGWRTQWKRDGEDEGRTVTLVGDSPARLYLPADAVRGRVMRLTAKLLGGRRVTAELDGERLGEATAAGSGYGPLEFSLPANLEGQVTLKLTFRGSGRHPTLGRGAALVDRIDFLTPEEQAAGGEGPGEPRAAAGEDGEPAGVEQSAGTTVRWALYLPAEARFRATLRPAGTGGAPGVAVRLVRDDGTAETLREAAPVEGSGESVDLDLSAAGGDAARLEWEVSGRGAVRWTAARVVVPTAAGDPPARTPARNLVVLLVDTLRADKLSRLGPSRVRADHLQRWAAEGVSFRRTIAGENWTKPSVATLLTGLTPTTHTAKSDRAMLPDEVSMLSEVLQAQGFQTACFIANGYVSDAFGFRQGWGAYTNYVRSGQANRAANVFDDAVEWLGRRNPDERFFLYLQTIDPHVPYIPPRSYLDLYDADAYDGPVKGSESAKLLERVKAGQLALTARDRARLEALYDGEITYHDDHAAKLYAALEAAGVLDDTLVVVTADHGEEFFDHGSVGHGHSLFQELIHVPLFLRLPSALPANREVDAPVGLVDVVPTALDLLGLPALPEAEGRSLVDLAWRGGTGAELAFSEFLEGQRAVVGPRFKLLQRGYTPILYDLLDDPDELRDAARLRPAAVRSLTVALGRHLRRLADRDGPTARDRPAPRDAQVDSDLEAQLRALGYLGGP